MPLNVKKCKKFSCFQDKVFEEFDNTPDEKNNQGQFPNPQEKLFLKLSLVVGFDKEFTDILTVKERAFLCELTPFFVVCRFRLNIHKITL